MTRLLVAATIALVTLMGGSGAALGRGATSDLRLSVPTRLSAGMSGAVAVRLPARIAAADGRILFDKSAAEVIGVTPRGSGNALAPVDVTGGVAFGAYGMSPRNGEVVIDVVFNALRDGQLTFRVLIDSAANSSGVRLALSNPTALRTLSLGQGSAQFNHAATSSRFTALRAAGALRDVVRDGLVGKFDLDTVRAAWELERGSGSPCSASSQESDANGDGCVDIVDLQLLTAAQGRRVGNQTNGGEQSVRQTSPTLRTSQAATISPNAVVFTVNTTADSADQSAGDGLCRDSQGRCTLRAAVTESNWSNGDNRIVFDLGGSAPAVIQLSSSLPTILLQDRSGGTLIDGYTKSGSQANTATFGSNATMGVEVRGNGGSPRGNAFRITSANNIIRGLSLTNWYRTIVLDHGDAHDNLIAGNWFGFNSSGSVHSYRGNHGVRLDIGSHDNQVGTSALADRNVIGNFTHAVDLYGPGTNNNVIQGNLLCTTPSGMTEASCSTAIDHNFGPKNNLHGGTNPGDRNIIGRTTLNGIEVSHGWDPNNHQSTPQWQNNNNRIIGNWIGFRGDGSYSAAFRSGQNSPNSNDSNGVNVYDGSNFNIVEGNYIASVWDGINFMSPNSAGNTARNNVIGESPLGQAAPLNRFGINVRNNSRSHNIEGNIIRNTGDDAIALTQKDVLWIRISRNIVTDTNESAIFITNGANNNTARPVITSATTIRADGTGIPGATVEVYRASRNAGQSGLPVEYLGSAIVANNGQWSAPIVVAQGQRVTALQITTVNNTSMLSTNVTASFEAPPPEPQASFTWAQRASTLTVDFTDTSSNTPAQWLWTFGDGTTSTEKNPTKTYAQPGQFTVSLTATNAGGSDSTSDQVNVVAPPAGTTYAADAFGRTTGGWGSADVGGAYTLQGPAADYNVGSGTGTMNLPAANTTRSALLNSVSRRDVDITVRVAVNKVAAGGNYFVYEVARRNGNSEYRPRIIFNANGTVSVSASVLANGTESALGTAVVVPGLSQGPNQFIWLRARVTGASPTAIEVKAWADGQSEPGAFQFTVTNSQAGLQVAGGVGLRTYIGGAVSTAPVVFTFDDYAVLEAL